MNDKTTCCSCVTFGGAGVAVARRTGCCFVDDGVVPDFALDGLVGHFAHAYELGPRSTGLAFFALLVCHCTNGLVRVCFV